jgi:hypothetical protein
LILRERAIRDQCFDLSHQRCDLILGRLCFLKGYKPRRRCC